MRQTYLKLVLTEIIFQGIFGSGAAHTTYADFFKLSEVVDPAFYIHVIEKPATKRW